VAKRHRLIRKAILYCSIPVLVATAVLLVMRRSREAPYVPGQEQHGITRALERNLEEERSRLRFTDVTAQAGLLFDHFPFERTSQLPEDMGSGAAWGDYDGDGFNDLYLVNFAAPIGVSDAELSTSSASSRLFRNRGDGTFEDVSAAAGVALAHRGMGAAWGDYDSDADLDLFVTSWGENVLFENRGDGAFQDVTRQAGLGGFGFWAGASWADFDLDGDLDLYVCGYVQYEAEEPGSARPSAGNAEFPFTLNPSSYPPHPNRLFVNNGDGTFDERAEAAGVRADKGRSLSAAWADFDADGRPDLYVANDVSDNLLYLNRGDGTFDDISYEALVADYRGAMGIAVGDWDADLDLDLFVTHWIAQENALYSNLSSSLTSGDSSRVLFGDDADRVGLGQISLDLIGWGTAFVDLDHDGWLELFVANGSTFQKRDDRRQLVPMHPHLYWNRGPRAGFFEVGEEAGIRTEPPGVGRGATFADYDGDGDLDLVIVRFGSSARLLRNDTQTGHHVLLRLSARSTHGAAIGARVVVHAGGRSFLRSVGSNPSYLSQNATDVHVGIDEATRIDSVEVVWPGGHREVRHGLDGDRIWHLREGFEPQLIATSMQSSQAPGARGRRTSDISELAVIADVTSNLTREQKRRFWELNKQAGRLFAAGRWSEAAAAFAEMSALDPTHEDALYYRGNCMLELERYAEAKSSWERLRDVNPTSSRAHVQIGLLHTMPETGDLFDLDAAVAAFEAAHRINKEESRPLVLWGEAALARGDLDTSATLLESAYSMNPGATSALYLAGYVAWKRGDISRAQELLKRAVHSLAGDDTPAPGVLEGETRSALMAESRKRAARRRLFAECLDELRDAAEPHTGRDFGCVEDARARFSKSSGF
jgi:tetratricopeptide (TPR) repeat protein